MNKEINFTLEEITSIITNTVKLKNKFLITEEDVFKTIYLLNNKIYKVINFIEQEFTNTSDGEIWHPDMVTIYNILNEKD